MSTDVVLLELVDDHIAVVTLNRPERRNAVNAEVTAALDRIVKRIEADPQIRVAILASSNDRVFCAGADISEMAAGRTHLLSTEDGGFAGFVDAKRAKPWIAAIRGSALGGGCELMLACDMAVASENTRIGLPEVKRCLIAAAGGVHRLPRSLPRAIALEMIATGEPIDAARAYAFGLVNRIAPSDAVLEVALDLARSIMANAPLAVVESLRIARIALEHPDADLRATSLAISAKVMTSEDTKEGMRAFLDKRPPVWSGR